MADALVVDERVAGDAGRDRERDRQPAAGRAAAHPAHQQHAGGDREHAGRLAGRQRRAEHGDRHDEHEHRRRAAGDRIDEAQVGALVGRREQREVDELERRRGGDVRPRGGVDVPGERSRPARTRRRAVTIAIAVTAWLSRASAISQFQNACRAAETSTSATAAALSAAPPAGPPPSSRRPSGMSSTGGWPSWPSSDASRPNRRSTVQSTISRSLRSCPASSRGGTCGPGTRPGTRAT